MINANTLLVVSSILTFLVVVNGKAIVENMKMWHPRAKRLLIVSADKVIDQRIIFTKKLPVTVDNKAYVPTNKDYYHMKNKPALVVATSATSPLDISTEELFKTHNPEIVDVLQRGEIAFTLDPSNVWALLEQAEQKGILMQKKAENVTKQIFVVCIIALLVEVVGFLYLGSKA